MRGGRGRGKYDLRRAEKTVNLMGGGRGKEAKEGREGCIILMREGRGRRRGRLLILWKGEEKEETLT